MGGGRVTLSAAVPVPVQWSELYRVFRSNENHRANGVRFSSDFKTLFSPVERTAPSSPFPPPLSSARQNSGRHLKRNRTVSRFERLGLQIFATREGRRRSNLVDGVCAI